MFILSAYLADSDYALREKIQWLNIVLPEIKPSHRIFLPCGKNKNDYIPGSLRRDDFLLDDYTYNLMLWQPPAYGIKLLNGINHTCGTWQHETLRYDRPPSEIATKIMTTIRNAGHEIIL